MTDDLRVRFLIVDDEQSIRKLCMTIGASLGFVCSEAESAEAAMAVLEAQAPDIVLTDLMLPSMTGVDLLQRIKALQPRTEVAIMTGHGSIESAVQTMKLGAYDYVTKPFRVEELKLILQRMAEKVRLVIENQFLRAHVNNEMQLNAMVGSSPQIQEVLRLIGRLKDSRSPVLVMGESGTGKELVARAIHFRGAFASRPFVAVDCGSLVPTLIEAELFGYEKGAFTGAVRASKGLFQAADGGTIFLDEIGELPLEMQTKLLRVLQEKEVRRVGSNERVKTDVRVIAASNRDLEAAYRDGTFRKDLFFRLNVISVHLPPLRERESDIRALVKYFLDKFCSEKMVRVSNAALRCLEQYDWPGNIRELENCIQRAVTLRNQDVIDVYDLPPAIRSPRAIAKITEPLASDAKGSNFNSASIPEGRIPDTSTSDLEDLERITIQRVFEEVNGDKTLAGKILGISRATLYRKLKRYNLLKSAAHA
ncbi:MAG TPA: sigma-54 dependent transcriptional regulator [Terriglobales bacterium]|jgi:two-component system response regulator AtoC|nr:sigma-54 dependent transcriptional regulator [Terriglobales bacterium]